MNNSSKLRASLTKYFSLDELESLCFELDIDKDNVPGKDKGKDYFVTALLSYVQRRELIPRLLIVCCQTRPNANWEDVIREAVQPSEPQMSSISSPKSKWTITFLLLTAAAGIMIGIWVGFRWQQLFNLQAITPPTYTPYPTYTPQSKAMVQPTYTPYPTYTSYPTYTPQSKTIAQPTYTPYPTYTPVPSPWLKLVAPEDNATFVGSSRAAVTLRWDWLAGVEDVESFDILAKLDNGDWFALRGGAQPNQRSLQMNFQELSGTLYWKVVAKVGLVTHTSEVRKIQCSP